MHVTSSFWKEGIQISERFFKKQNGNLFRFFLLFAPP